MTAVNIPDEAWVAAAEIGSPLPAQHSVVSTYARRCVLAAAPFIAAAELGVLADEMAERTVTEEDVRARIAQLTGKSDEWCNCQAIHGTVNYPGPWHPMGDTPTCPRRAAELRGEG